MRQLRPLLRPLLAALLLLPAAAVALPAQGSALPELTRTTVITASHAGYVDLVLPVDARVSARYEDNADVQISGEGRYVGFWLGRGTSFYGATDGLSSVRLPSFLGSKQQTTGSYYPAGECRGEPEAMPVHYDCTSQTPPQAILLREGVYRLLVLTDGSPLQITLTLHGLAEGTTTVSPAQPLASEERSLPRLDSVGDQLVTFGATAPVQGYQVDWVMATASKPADATMDGSSVCFRQDEGTPPPMAYGPLCTGGVGSSYDYSVQAAGLRQGLMGMSVSSGTDGVDTGLGGSFGSSEGVELGPNLGVWLQLPG